MMKKVIATSAIPASRKYNGLKRREFFKLMGGGLFIFFNTRDTLEIMALPVEKRQEPTPNFNAFLKIGEDGIVKAFTGKIEMGQGPITSLVQEMADELDVSFTQVKMLMGDTDLCPWDDGTWGSLTTRQFGQIFRAAAAEAKAVLLQMASEKMKVPVAQLTVKDGVIIDKKNSNNKVSYGQLTEGKRIERFMDKKPPLKDPADFNIIGKPYFRVDSRLKVTGKAKYSGDFHPQDMLYARILRPSSHYAKLVSMDTSEAEKIQGVQIVRDGDLIAVLHELRDIVDEAIIKIKTEWSIDDPMVDDKTIYDHMIKSVPTGEVIDKAGDLATGKSLSKNIFNSVYYDSFVAHAPIEPHTGLAYMEGDRVIVRGSTQTPFPATREIAEALNIPVEKIRVIPPFVGGGFGGKGSNNKQMVEAARLTKLTGKPVMVLWTRKEEFFYDHFHSAAIIRIDSGIDQSGKITMWDYHVYFAGSRGSDTYYDVPNRCTTSYGESDADSRILPLKTGPWRAPGNNTNTFARESQIEIMAAAAGIDPLEFRLKNLKDQRLIDVLKAAADKFGYKPAKGPSGRGIGIAGGSDAGTYVAIIAEIKVDKETGQVQVIRVACAQDMGLCVNPQGATIQIEGCITMGMGYALSEEIQFTGGKIHNDNYYSYEIPRFSWVPKIETVILDRQNKAPQGGGEPAIIVMGGVIANAIFDATGARLYRMPMTQDRILEALKKL
jgi:nicotinate dehydrogenase subunit B